MIRLMIVDDEPIEIEGIRATVDFSRLGIDEVLDAANIRQAKEIMDAQTVNILLCDIEMPQGDGLELLEWVRRCHPKTECVFLTCHADFRYAKKAIQLGSLDYLLKPAMGSEIEAVLEKAVQKVREQTEDGEYRQFSRLWLKHQPLLTERFWLDILNQRISLEFHEIRNAAERINLPGLEELKLLPVLIRVKRWNEEMSVRDEKLMEFGLKNVAQEMILKEDGSGIVFDLSAGCMLALLYLDSFSSMDSEALRAGLEKYVTTCHELLKAELCCYVGMEVFCFELPAMADRLVAIDRNNVSRENQVLFLNRETDALEDIPLPNANVLLAMLERLESARVISEISVYMDALTRSTNLNAYGLHQLQHFFMNLFFTFSKAKNFDLPKLLADDKARNTFEVALQSVSGMKQWAAFCVERLCGAVRETEQAGTVVARTKRFIEEHLDEDLSNDDIAAHVFLNPIYLNRIFRKETGHTLAEFVQFRRMELAKELLKNTDLPVGSIGSRIGYANFSHFSRVFRKLVGSSPVDFRRMHSGEK